MKTLISADNTWALFAILVVVAALAIWMEQKYKWAGKVTGCVIALIGAMILSNIRVIPTDAPAYDFVWSYVVPLAVPLLLFNAKWTCACNLPDQRYWYTGRWYCSILSVT